MSAVQSGVETQWPAPAKLNLFLHVTGRRPMAITSCRRFFSSSTCATRSRSPCATTGVSSVRRARRGSTRTLTSPYGPPGLCRLRRAAGWGHPAYQAHPPWEVDWAGELGRRYGSAGAERSLALPLSIDELAGLGLPLGADVPVFIRGFSAWGEGVGERLTPVELPERWYVVIHPGVPVSTRDVFQSPELTRNSPIITIRAFFESGGRNDCEPVVRARYPEVADGADWLARMRRRGLPGRAPVSSRPARVRSKRSGLRHGCLIAGRAFVARGLNVSPMHGRQAVGGRERAPAVDAACTCWGVAKW